MACPHCQSTATAQRSKKTHLGYRTCCCHPCRCTFNERTGSPFNDLAFPTASVLLVVRWRLRSKLSVRDRAAMFLERGFEFTHEAVCAWETRFAPLGADTLRSKRTGQAGRSWDGDETSIRVGGVWTYRYRAVDRDGNLANVRLSAHRDREGAKQFFQQAVATVGHAPDRVTTDGHASYPRAIRETLGEDVIHGTNPYLTNRLAHEHRGIKQRSYPMRGVGNVAAAARCCRSCDEVRHYFRPRTTMRARVPP